MSKYRRWLAVTAMLTVGSSEMARGAALVTAQPNPSPALATYVADPASAAAVPRDALIKLLRQHVKYVFVIFNENHSFDNEFGTFPGANGLFSDGFHSRDAAHTPGFTQTYIDESGSAQTIRPFRLGPEQNSTFTDSVDHSHKGLAQKLRIVGGRPTMQGFAEDEFHRFAMRGGSASAAMGRQFARLAMSYIDCDTVPFLWQYASRFVLFDNIFATENTPSTPNAVAMLAGQSGETQWVKHASTGQPAQPGSAAAKTQGPPLVNDPQPIWGSQLDATVDGRQSHGSKRESYKDSNVASNLTFASMPLTFAGAGLSDAMVQDRAATADQADIGQDIPFIASRRGTPVNWRWYQEGYDHEPTDPPGPPTHGSYVSHHSGPQYFGYIANNPSFAGNLRGMGDLFADMRSGNLPEGGGVFYIRGGFENLSKMMPPIQNPRFPAALTPADIQAIVVGKMGDDDHPAYADRQISETMAARVVNAVAASPPIWSQSAIVITYDESDGFYDHAIPRVLSYGPDGLPLARGIRVPMIVISPYARAHVVSHAEGDHNAVLQTIEAIYDLPPLASLPDEAQALLAGQDARFAGPGGFVQKFLGPRDLNSPQTDDLLSAFEPRRLSGTLAPLPASYAMIPEAIVNALPHYGGHGCAAIDMVPEDRRQGISTQVPPNFNTLPATLPTYN